MLKKLLIIDADDQALVTLVAGLSARYRVIIARHTEEGLERIMMDEPDVVLCAPGLLDTTGAELRNRLRSSYPQYADVPFVIQDGLSDLSSTERAIARALSQAERARA